MHKYALFSEHCEIIVSNPGVCLGIDVPEASCVCVCVLIVIYFWYRIIVLTTEIFTILYYYKLHAQCTTSMICNDIVFDTIYTILYNIQKDALRERERERERDSLEKFFKSLIINHYY